MSNPTSAKVITAERRAAQFLIPSHDTPEACATSFKRAVQLLEQAAVEFFHAGREDLAEVVHDALLHAALEGSDAPRP